MADISTKQKQHKKMFVKMSHILTLNWIKMELIYCKYLVKKFTISNNDSCVLLFLLHQKSVKQLRNCILFVSGLWK